MQIGGTKRQRRDCHTGVGQVVRHPRFAHQHGDAEETDYDTGRPAPANVSRKKISASSSANGADVWTISAAVPT